MLQEYWLALAFFATLLTLLYTVITPGERVFFTSGGAAFAWTILALTGPTVTKTTDSGITVAAPVPMPVLLFIGGLAAFSLLIFVLYYWGLYPPDSADTTPQEASV